LVVALDEGDVEGVAVLSGVAVALLLGADRLAVPLGSGGGVGSGFAGWAITVADKSRARQSPQTRVYKRTIAADLATAEPLFALFMRTWPHYHVTSRSAGPVAPCSD